VLPRLRLYSPLAACVAALALPSLASAEVSRAVSPGESLWSIASANGLQPGTLAAYNGLAADHELIIGSTIRIPARSEAGTAQAAAAPAASGSAPAAMGGYTVRVGDTLSGLAAQAGVSTTAMAQMNGLDPNAFLLAGTVIKLPTGAPAPARSAQPAPATVVPKANPDPTPVRLDGGQFSSIAAQHGAPASLAAAIGWQESGFNNSMVSSANARGVMQVMPGTWDYVQQYLTSQKLDPDSAQDNVRAGSLYLAHLLRDTGGDERLATAGYYQGLASVRKIGLLPETEQYVDNVMALRSRFGGQPSR
jgi:N-acetylmuramoyl-L-alanine amidase